MTMSGCTGGTDVVDDETETTVAPTAIQYILDEQSVINALEKAMEVYAVFNLCSMELDTSKAVTANGMTYCNVVSNEYSSYADLRTMVYSLFSVEIGDALLCEDSDRPPYIDYNGELYGLDFARGSDITKGEYTVEVENVSNTEIICHVSVETIDFDENADIDSYRKVTGYEDYTFRYEYMNNKWIFTEFPYFY